MKHLILFAGMIVSAQFLAGADSPVPPPSLPAAQPAATARNADAEKLIDELVNVSTETIGANAKYMTTNQFVLNDRPGAMASGIGGVALPPVPPAVRKLVQMGVAAVPSLLDHLSDTRETKLDILNPGIPAPGTAPAGVMMRFGAIVFGNEYDPRYRNDPERMPQGLIFNAHGGRSIMARAGPGDAYTMVVGDLCYAILGQIVNRHLMAARYQGTGSAVINSPVHTPALAAAARADWAGLTAEQHRASLELDMAAGASQASQLVDFHSLPSDALERLSYYYPETAKALALKSLSLPLQDWHTMPTSIPEQLLTADDSAAQTAWLTTMQKQAGNGFIFRVQELLQAQTQEPPPIPGPDGLPEGWSELHGGTHPGFIHQTGANGPSERVLPQPEWDRARAALKIIADQKWVASFDKNSVVEIHDLTSMIGALDGLPDPAIDAAVYDLFHRALALQDPKVVTDGPLDQLVLACAQRLAGKGHDDEYRTYLEHLLTQLANTGRTPNPQYIANINDVLAKLGSAAAPPPAVKP